MLIQASVDCSLCMQTVAVCARANARWEGAAKLTVRASDAL
jgi:hypothetical protein